MKQKQKAVWITGISSGIGKAIVQEFINNNIHVIGTTRNLSSTQQLLDSLKEKNDVLTIHQLDITDYESVRDFCSSVKQQFEITTLINNAGVTSFKNAIEDSIQEIDNIIKTNLLGSIYTIKEILPHFLENNNGTIINILSVVTKKIFLASSAYSASKAGLLAYTNVLREEVREKNIRVINISPGATATAIWPESVIKKHSDRMMNASQIAKFVFQLHEEKSNLVVEDVVIRPITGDL